MKIKITEIEANTEDLKAKSAIELLPPVEPKRSKGGVGRVPFC